MKTLLWLALFSTSARAATLESAQPAAGALALRATRARPGRFPRGEDPRPDRVSMTLSVSRVLQGGPAEDQQLARPRARLQTLSKSPSHVDIVIERDPEFRERWTARVRAEGRTVEGQAVWTREGTPPSVELVVTWRWPVPGVEGPGDEFSVRTHVHVDPQGRLTPVAYRAGRRDPVERGSISIQVPGIDDCHDHCMPMPPEDVTLAEAAIVRLETR